MNSLYIGFLFIPSILSSWGILPNGDYQKSVSNSKHYYTTLSSAIDMDSLFMLSLISEKENSFDELDIQRIVDSEYKNDPFFRLLDNKSIISASSYQSAMDEQDMSGLNKAMIKAIYCDIYGYNQMDFNRLLEFRNDGYGDTHVISTIGILLTNNCLNPELLHEYQQIIADAIVLSHDGTFSDLNSEKAVVLYWAGYDDYVKEEWIKVIASNQNRDFGWGDRQISNPHTTGLSALALSYFNEKNTPHSLYLVSGNNIVLTFFQNL